MECMKLGSQHELVKKYFRIVHESMSKVGKKKEWLKEFGENKTDFQRVCYLLRALEAANAVKAGIDVLGLPFTREAMSRFNGKSDEASTRIREFSNRLWESRKVMKSLEFYTAALFHAASDSARALALGNRSCVLFSLNCFEEAATDASEALKLGFPQSKAARLHIRIAQCHQRRNHLPEARQHFQEAISLLDHSEVSMKTLLLPLAKRGLLECSTERENTKSMHPSPSESVWKCIRYEPPKFSKSQTIKATKELIDDTSETSCRLLSAPDGTVRLRNTGRKRGWTLEVTRNVSVGEVLIVDKPYASVLVKEFLYMYCYHCYNRCFNLKPCSGCSFVGFCSPSCAESAMRRDGGRRDGLGRHVHDCGGLVPCLLLDNYAGWPKESKDSVGGPNVSHLAFACIGNTAPDCLLDYICSTGRYEKLEEGGRGHQAFVGSSIRDVAPSILDPSDYSAAAWLVACSEYRSRADLWQRTVAAVFLTYCLSIGDYPMAWFGEADLFYTPPSPESRPDRLPASWIAACLLYHLQSVPVNAHSHADDVFSSLQNLASYTMRDTFSALYPTLSLVNHSCDPSTFRTCTSGATCFLSALRPLTAGTEIFDCYTDCFSTKPRDVRQSELNSHYLFQCACEACTKDWPTLFDPKRRQMEFLRCPQCSGVLHLPAWRCPHCRSTRALTSYTHLVNVEVPKQMELVSEGVVRNDVVDVAGELLKKLDLLVLRPGTVWDQAQELFKMVVNFTRGSWILEPSD
ncbi:SET and MYND domain containing protein 4 [Echinococcus multilocularis]|uniref:SET and MYND domain containing protein 4 n=1 Tax=Echinococcus multilocularis TaxID=6211 RepID=A0A068YLH7_ECHMU|nr:SET and MYND domain containing protein 4 [Echinococcus multilocularis]